MRGILHLHARTAAEQVRWRVLHGALSTSNMGLFGEMVDLWLATAQARTAPIHAARTRRRDAVFGREHLSRAPALHAVYLSVTEALTADHRKYFGAERFDCVSEFHRFYEEELSIQLLLAAGFDDSQALGLRSSHPAVVKRYVDVLTRLMALRNPGMLNARIATGERIGVVDVFRVLSLLPRHHFRFFRSPDADLTGVVRKLARIQVSGSAARRRRNRRLAYKHLDRLARIYGELVTEALGVVSPNSRSWRGWSTAAAAICSRAERRQVSLRAYRR